MALVLVSPILLAVALQVLVARWVMRDAAARGLDPALWGTAAFIAPLFGVAAYLHFRV